MSSSNLSRYRHDQGLITLAYTALGTAIIIFFSLIPAIPALGPLVPFTLQTFAIYLIPCIFGAKIAFYSTLLYLLLGFMGLPLFSGYTGGLAAFSKPTCGFLLSFPLVAIIIGLFAQYAATRISQMTSSAQLSYDKNSSVSSHKKAWVFCGICEVGVLLGTLIVFTGGIIGLMVITSNSGPINFSTALSVGVLPFVGIDIVKGILAVWIAWLIHRRFPSMLPFLKVHSVSNHT